MKLSWSLPAAVLTLGMLSTDAHAQERQFRKLVLVDGRTLRAEVLATEGTGLRMRTPQGETLVSFELLMDMVPITLSEFEDQADERVWLALHEPNPGLLAIYEGIDGLEVSRAGASDLVAGVTESLEECGDDLDCARQAVSSADWMWLAFVAPPTDASDAALVIRGGPSQSKQVTVVEAADTQPRTLWVAVHESLGLEAPEEIPRSVLEAFPGAVVEQPRDESAWTASKVNSASLIPLPGYPSLAQGDTGRFALGLGVALAGTGAALGASTQIKSNSGEGLDALTLTGVTAGTFLVLTGVLNNALGHATLKANGGGATASVTPLPGGAQLSFHTKL